MTPPMDQHRVENAAQIIYAFAAVLGSKTWRDLTDAERDYYRRIARAVYGDISEGA